MRARYARQIRAGILSVRDPQLACPIRDDCGETLIDFARFFDQEYAYLKANEESDLASRARKRTKPWTSVIVKHTPKADPVTVQS